MIRQVLDRIKDDFKHGGSLGPKSTARLISFLDILVTEIEDLKRDRTRSIEG